MPPPLTVAFSILLEVLTDSVPVSSMLPPLIVAPSKVTVLSMVTVLASVKAPASVTPSRVTVSSVRVWPLAVDDSVPPPLTVAFSISLEVLTDSVPVSSMLPPLMVAPASSIRPPELVSRFPPRICHSFEFND